jgi:hypothetical protein
VARDLGRGLGVLAALTAGLVAVAVWAGRGAIGSKWRSAVATTVADTRLGLLARNTWPGVLALSAAALLGYLGLFLVAARTAGSTVPAGRLLPLLMLALLAMALPVSVGGWGPREAFSAVAFGATGLGAEQGLTIAVTYGVLAFVAALPGAAVLALRRAAPPVALPAGVAEDRQVVGERSD